MWQLNNPARDNKLTNRLKEFIIFHYFLFTFLPFFSSNRTYPIQAVFFVTRKRYHDSFPGWPRAVWLLLENMNESKEGYWHNVSCLQQLVCGTKVRKQWHVKVTLNWANPKRRAHRLLEILSSPRFLSIYTPNKKNAGYLNLPWDS